MGRGSLSVGSIASAAHALTRDAIAALFGFDHAVATGRGRSALALALMASGLPQGAPVLLPANICPSVIAAINFAGMVPHILPVVLTTGLPDEAEAIAKLRSMQGRGAILLAHLYGFHCAHYELIDVAKECDWFVVESDPMAVRAFIASSDRLTSDILIASFGDGKALDAHGGGALLTNESSLSKKADDIVREWPRISGHDDDVETDLMLHRRALRQMGKEALYAPALAHELSQIPRAEAIDWSALAEAVDGLSGKRARAQADWSAWAERLNDSALLPLSSPISPWRMIALAPDADSRDRCVQALRREGFNAGTNYPSAASFFPFLAHHDCTLRADAFGARVLNLWLPDATPSQGDAIMRVLRGVL